MFLESIKKVASGKFLHFYNLYYRNKNGHEKVYEMISRNPNIQNEIDLSSEKTQAIIVVAFNKDHTKILLNKEFRMAINSFIYNLPAGLIEKGESDVEAAKRELKEETGLDVVKVLKILPPTFSSVGISNEKTEVIFCEVDGKIGGTPEENEEIECEWWNKEDISTLIFSSNEFIAARTQMLLYMWIQDII